MNFEPSAPLSALCAPWSGIWDNARGVGKGPIVTTFTKNYLGPMNLLLLMLLLLVLFGGGGFYFGGPLIGGSGLGVIHLVCLMIYIMGGWRTKS